MISGAIKTTKTDAGPHPGSEGRALRCCSRFFAVGARVSPRGRGSRRDAVLPPRWRLATAATAGHALGSTGEATPVVGPPSAPSALRPGPRPDTEGIWSL